MSLGMCWDSSQHDCKRKDNERPLVHARQLLFSVDLNETL